MTDFGDAHRSRARNKPVTPFPSETSHYFSVLGSTALTETIFSLELGTGNC